MKPTKKYILLAICITAPVNAATIVIGPDEPYPVTAELVTVPSESSGFGDDANESLAQSFTVTSAFSIASILIPYENDASVTGNKDWDMTVTIFPVADRFATNLTPSGAAVFSETFTFPFTGLGDGSSGANTEVIAQIDLSTAVALAATTGSAGYAMQITESSDADFNPGFEWMRPTSEAYAGGQMYEDGVVKNPNATSGLGERDLSFALIAVPEPSGALLFLSGAVLFLRRRRN